MATITQETRFELARREVLAVAHAKGQTLRCEAGELWITADDAAGDVVLRAGEDWTVPGDADVIVSAFQASTVSLRQAPRDALAAGARRMLASLRDWRFPPRAAFSIHVIR